MTVFLIDVSLSALNVANRNVLILLCEECTRVGKIWGILFVLVCEAGDTIDCFLCAYFQLAYTLKKWRIANL